jgi:biotin carboxyl carrier protein
MQGYLIIGEEAHALAICPAMGGGYRLADGAPLTLRESGGRMRIQVGETVREAEIVVAGETVWIHLEGVAYEITWRSAVERLARSADGEADGAVHAPMPGAVVKVLVQPGDVVRAGDVVMVIESMKLETTLRAPRPGVVGHGRLAVGESFERGAMLIEIGEGG